MDHYEPMIPAYSTDLIRDLDRSHPASEVADVLMSPHLSDEQRLHAAVSCAAVRKFIDSLIAAVEEDAENVDVTIISSFSESSLDD